MKIKEFKTLSEQVAILKSKGLIINNDEWAKEVLLRENYLFLMGYRHLFLRSDVDRRYVDGVRFEEVYSLFLFDRDFRNIIFKNLLIIENNLKSIFSYQLSKKYGYKEKDYLNPRNFTREPAKNRQVADLISKMKRQIRVNSKQHRATLHYIDNYGYIPLWVLVKVLSFGIISELYSILKQEDQLSIAAYYDIDIENMISYLVILANYRNLCAHEDILYEHKTQRMINDNKYHLALNIPVMDNEYIYGKGDLFALILIMKALLRKNEFSKMINEISMELYLLKANIRSIPFTKILDRMGFPENWLDISKV
ncbi:MAG: Abi family protein [Bacilli bacterium]|jgi:abortive infection bacteriophage resistance protein